MEKLEVWQTGVKPVELSVGLELMREMGCASNFGGKVIMQIGFFILNFHWLGRDIKALSKF